MIFFFDLLICNQCLIPSSAPPEALFESVPFCLLLQQWDTCHTEPSSHPLFRHEGGLHVDSKPRSNLFFHWLCKLSWGGLKHVNGYNNLPLGKPLPLFLLLLLMLPFHTASLSWSHLFVACNSSLLWLLHGANEHYVNLVHCHCHLPNFVNWLCFLHHCH
jgi:hypothetical protein